jgi:hypothetical protein
VTAAYAQGYGAPRSSEVSLRPRGAYAPAGGQRVKQKNKRPTLNVQRPMRRGRFLCQAFHLPFTSRCGPTIRDAALPHDARCLCAFLMLRNMDIDRRGRIRAGASQFAHRNSAPRVERFYFCVAPFSITAATWKPEIFALLPSSAKTITYVPFGGTAAWSAVGTLYSRPSLVRMVKSSNGIACSSSRIRGITRRIY